MRKYHLIVIGAGSGGLVSAVGAAGLGAKVALLEKEKMGGDCLNTGCVPSKAIIRTAKLAYDAKRASEFGLTDTDLKPSLGSVMDSVREVILKLEHHDSEERMRQLGIDVYKGDFKFISPRQVSNGKETLQAKRFVIATGAKPFLPPIQGLREIPYLTSDTVWNLTRLPARLVVLGGGPIGCELAQVFVRLGSKVAIVEMMEQLLMREEAEASRILREQFEKEGMDVLVGHRAVSVMPMGEAYTLTVHKGGAEKRIPFDQILVAVGRAPNVSGLDLTQAGVGFSEKGIKVDARMRTHANHIYACGDVVGPYQFTHTADHQARLILRNALFPGSSKIDYRVVPWCTFTDPEVARVGINEKEALEKKIPHDVFHDDIKDLDRAVCDREAKGFIRVVTKKGTDTILGATLVGSHAGDLIHELVLAMHQNIGLKKMASMIHIYPTLAEISKRLADTYQRTRLSPRTQSRMQTFFRWRWG